MQNFLPISIDIAGERILIIGGGQSAWSKLQILKRFNAEVDVLALDICDEIRNSGVKFRQKAYEKEDLRGYLMLYSCSNNPELDRQIVQDGKAMGVLVNIHDQPALCRFISPAIYKNGIMTVAVGSNGQSVHESIRLRNYLQHHLEKEYFKQ